MANDVTVDLIRSLTEAIDGPSLAREMRGPVEGWESLALILEFGEGFRSAHGYTYSAGGVITAVACNWSSIESAVNAYLGSYYEPGALLPVKMLVQFDRTSGTYKVRFEDTDEERWAVKPANYVEMREELRPTFD